MQINKNLSVPRWYLIGHFGMLSKSVQHRVLQLLPVRLVGWSTVLWGQDCGFGWFEFLCSHGHRLYHQPVSASCPQNMQSCSQSWLGEKIQMSQFKSFTTTRGEKKPKTGSTCPALSSCTVHSHHAPSSYDFVCCHFSSLREYDTAFYTSSL